MLLPERIGAAIQQGGQHIQSQVVIPAQRDNDLLHAFPSHARRPTRLLCQLFQPLPETLVQLVQRIDQRCIEMVAQETTVGISLRICLPLMFGAVLVMFGAGFVTFGADLVMFGAGQWRCEHLLGSRQLLTGRR